MRTGLAFGSVSSIGAYAGMAFAGRVSEVVSYGFIALVLIISALWIVRGRRGIL